MRQAVRLADGAGLPFVGGIVGMSFLLSRFTQTRYDHAEAKVQTMDAEEALALRADRRRVDIREEYYVRPRLGRCRSSA